MSKDDIDFHLLIALVFYYRPRKKSDHCSSLLGAAGNRCMNLTFHDKFQVKMMYAESYDIRTTTNSKGHQLQSIHMHKIE